MILLFFIGIFILVIGYLTYAKYVVKQFGIEPDNPTPATVINDGVDFVPIDKKKNQLIQLLNIAGTGPIYGPIAAAIFGPIVFILIPLGNIFAGAVHDFAIGFMAMRNNGKNVPSIASKYIGNWSRYVFTIFSVLLLILVATVFVTSPALLLSTNFGFNNTLVLIIIFAYYILSTIMPIDKIIGKIYPFITGLLLAGTSLVLIMILFKSATGSIETIPFSFDLLFTWQDQTSSVIIPGFFVLVSCGLISGFHSTQSPIVAKTIKNESESKETFYLMMVIEGVIAMIWALVTMLIFPPTDIISSSAPELIPQIATIALGSYLSWIIILAVIILPITSGDTAFRSLRMVIAEVINMNQAPIRNRIFLCIPIFLASFLLIVAIDFSTLWQYFTWANHLLAVLTLLTTSAYLMYRKGNYLISFIPAIILFVIDMIYLLTDGSIGFGMSNNIVSFAIACVIAIPISFIILFTSRGYKIKKDNDSLDDYELEI